jgi:hypothetical protein
MANLFILNFGTFVETHRFKALSMAADFTEVDLLDSTSPGPGGLVQKDGVQLRPFTGGSRVYSFYGLSPTVWTSQFTSGKSFTHEFKKWISNALESPVHCVYMTGHHWSHEGDLTSTLSWGHSQRVFHARFDMEKQTLEFGVHVDEDKEWIDVDTANLRTECKLVFGFGCDVASGSNSTKYQNFFKPSKPVICGWTTSISLPKSEKSSVNKRFFEYIDKYIALDPKKVPQTDRLIWLYDNDPMQLVKAWGWATKYWKQSRARARDRDGNFWKFKIKQNGWPEPVKA